MSIIIIIIIIIIKVCEEQIVQKRERNKYHTERERESVGFTATKDTYRQTRLRNMLVTTRHHLKCIAVLLLSR